MKEAFAYYSKCNKAINENMYSVIVKNIEDPWSIDLPGYYFKSLGQILEHIYVSDMVWMNEFLGINSYGFKMENEVGKTPEYGKRVFESLQDLNKSRVKLDDFIVSYMLMVEATDFKKMVVRTTRSAGKIERAMWKAIMHFFNHQTHHRGQISNILDDMNIENNYSNMIFVE